MPGNRQAATEYILKNLEAILPGNSDTPRYKRYLEGLTEKEFEAYMLSLKSGEKYLTITAPNFAESTISIERNFALADKLGIPLFQKVWHEDADGNKYLTPIEFLVVLVPMRLASQRLAKKMSIPRTQRVINTLTGQPTGDSKGAAISFPELRVCAAMGLDSTMIELMKYRGGDLRGAAALNASLLRTGSANLKTLAHFASGVESTATLRTYFNSIMLKANL